MRDIGRLDVPLTVTRTVPVDPLAAEREIEGMPRRPMAVVTGASGALGAEITRQLIAKDWFVLATYRTRRPETAQRGSLWERFDTSEEATWDRLRLVAEDLPHRLDAVFACAGAPSSKKTVTETPMAEFEEVYRANVTSLAAAWQALAPLARRTRASLLAVGSDAGRAARPGNGPYSAAKAALEALVITLAKEEAQHGVRVNLLAPSLIDSPLADHVMALKGVTDKWSYFGGLPWGRPLSLEEVATACIDLATAPHWSYATGQVYPLLSAV
ncbi:NAD(P)-dependent dehydrogenase (short-subunit alcohol dehydrogenase family) [Streptomyces sp. 3211.6]|uniref:SDR family NAD(P)-dependent oxidoreductase n=1 Tax=Streptomyces sp. 3211.6 TaxID=1938845 RepID=UPI000EB11BD8|nr:SDR family oxidoreductase [Streptomyces sp. 3211.6]RKT02923.1 NAD(P)-dependent dehydrogenase (short-subunit alcohol dehydrogenase family) [Streptomyces sp. 3211.6]